MTPSINSGSSIPAESAPAAQKVQGESLPARDPALSGPSFDALLAGIAAASAPETRAAKSSARSRASQVHASAPTRIKSGLKQRAGELGDELMQRATLDASRIAAQELQAPAAQSAALTPSTERVQADKPRGARAESVRSNQTSGANRSAAQGGESGSGGGGAFTRQENHAQLRPPPMGGAEHSAPAGQPSTNAVGAPTRTAPSTAQVASATGPATRAVGATSNATAPSAIAGAAASKAGREQLVRTLAQAGAPARRAIEQHNVVASTLRGLGMALRQGEGQATITLAPESLGHLRIDVRLEAGMAQVVLRPASGVAHQLLTDSVETLRTALEAQGLSVQRLEVEPPPAPTPGTDARADAQGQDRPQDAPGTALTNDDQSGSRSGRGERWNTSAGGAERAGTDAQDSGVGLAAAIDVGAGAVRLGAGAFDWIA